MCLQSTYINSRQNTKDLTCVEKWLQFKIAGAAQDEFTIKILNIQATSLIVLWNMGKHGLIRPGQVYKFLRHISLAEN